MATPDPSSLDSPQNPVLPPELMNTVFEFLAAEKDWTTLGACSLLSHRYFRQARTLLFASITLKLRTHPNPILIHHVVRRIHGLYEVLRRDPEAANYITRFEILDSYPVYDSQWITQQASLPRLINKLTAVRHCAFGCEVGYLQWVLLSTELATSLKKLFSQPVLGSLTLSNIGGIPMEVLDVSVRYLCLNNVSVAPPVFIPDPFLGSRLCYLSLRTVSLENTASAWALMRAHAANLKLIKWRCWEDPQAHNGVSIPGPIDLGLLPALKKLSVRMSYGKAGRDLSGFCDLLEAVSHRSQLACLELSILFPLQMFPATMPEIHGHAIWTRLAVALLRLEYCNLRRVHMELTVHEKVRMWNGRRVNSVTEFRKQMKHSLRALSSISSFHFKFKVRAFHHR